MLKNYKGHLRMRSKPCEFVSESKDVLRYDEDNYTMIKPQHKTSLESEMVSKERTTYKTYLEVKVTSRMSGSIWDDSLNLKWE
jgi:hypothetical protein